MTPFAPKKLTLPFLILFFCPEPSLETPLSALTIFLSFHAILALFFLVSLWLIWILWLHALPVIFQALKKKSEIIRGLSSSFYACSFVFKTLPFCLFDQCRLLFWIVPLGFTCRNLISNVIVFGDGVFERWLGPKGGVLIYGISALIKISWTTNYLTLILPCEDTMRSWQFANWKRVLTRTRRCWHPDL